MDTKSDLGKHSDTDSAVCNANNNLLIDKSTLKPPTTEDLINDSLTISVKHDGISKEITTDKDDTKPGMESDHWDKGWAWLVVIGASICNLIVFGSLKSAGMVLNEVTARYQASPIAGSLFIIVNVTCTILWTPVASHLTNKVPCRNLVMAGGLLISAGMLTAAFGESLAVAYVGLGLLCGSGGGFVLAPSYIIINQYCKEKRSKAFAIATAGMGIGALTFAPVLAYWFSLYGYTGGLFLNAGLFLNLQVAGALMRPPPKGTVIPQTENETETETENETFPVIKAKSKPSKLKLLRNPIFLLYLFNMLCALFPQFLNFLPAYGLELGIPTGYSSIMISCHGFMDIIGRIGSGFFFDRVVHGRKRAYHSIFGIAAGVCVAMCGYISSTKSLLICIFPIGFMEGSFSAQRTVVPFEFVDAQDMSNAVGLIIFAECIGSILGPIMQGAIKSVYGSYAMGFAIGGSLFALASFIMLCDFVVRTACWGIRH